VLCATSIAACSASSPWAARAAGESAGTTRTYYIAADEVTWDYAPSGKDLISGMPFDGAQKIYTERGKYRIGRIYRKAMYREYTDGSFSKLKPRTAAWKHLGLLGPLIRAEVGDTIKVVFRNNASRPYSIHPHGVSYAKDSEGVAYDMHGGAGHATGVVAPRHTHTYTWNVPERAGPGPSDPSSIVWLYHSHVDEQKDIDAGLVGAMIITASGMSKADGTPKDVDREFVNLFQIYDENQSWYATRNIQTYAGDPKGTMKKRGDFIGVDPEGIFSLNGTGFADANLKFSINGYLYGNIPKMVMRKGERVRWYQMTVGFGFNFHTPHWHGNTVLLNKSRTDVTVLSPAQMVTVDMQPDNVGTWMYHCHVSDHMHGGMIALYQVTP
jgi:hephaestin